MQKSLNQEDFRVLIICFIILLGFALIFPTFKNFLDKWADQKYSEKEKLRKQKKPEEDKPER